MATDDFCGALGGKSCVEVILGPVGDLVLLIVAGLVVLAAYFVYRAYLLLKEKPPSPI